MNKLRALLGPAMVLLAFGMSGCDGTSPVGVSGEVSLDGQPLPSGTIVFEPLPGSDGQRRDATIENGQFTLPSNQGMLPGQEFQVLIKAFRKTGRMYRNADPSAASEEMEQYLPEIYNTATALRVTVSPNKHENHYKFDLASTRSK